MRDDDVEALAALGAAVRGDVGPAAALLHRLAGITDARAEAWRLALTSQLRLLQRDVSHVARADVGPPGLASLVALLATAREQLLALDRGARDTLARADLSRAHGTTALTLELRVLELWCNVLDGQHQGVSEAARALEADGLRARVPGVVIEASALRALVLLERELEEAVSIARRSSRMARTEGLPQPHFLANLVLARVRRLSGRPHLALRILGALQGVVPAVWRPWLGWELAMAGADVDDGLGAHVTRARRASDTAALEAALAPLEARFEPRSFPGIDVSIARATLDPRGAGPHAPDSLVRWRAGLQRETPLGAFALAGVRDDGALAWIVARPGAAAERLLAPALGVWSRTQDGTQELVCPAQAGGRIGHVLGALLFAGAAGLPEEALFAEVYGFAYVRELHVRVLAVLVHRVRATLRGAELVRDGGVLRLVLHGPVCSPDPSCVPRLEDRVLVLLARRGRSSARDAARLLGVPLRSAQAALEALVVDSVLVRDRSGRSVDYRVEDTTFEEPTGLQAGRLEG